MKRTLIPFIFATVLAACSNQTPASLTADSEQFGCNPATGASYSFLKQSCVQWFNVADIKLADPNNETLAVYVILSEDKMLAEVNAADLPENTILQAVKGGYVAKDKKVRLKKVGNEWKIYK